ncbi:VaFE repeat-containing surface-anchored protein [Slackia heliotrinireducens]|uniref:VaFE repeat-containing surface-anchored protein n=1 Tax=Slackia heliotrinireducens TaxID=84110 RepID=UPI0033162608
MNRPTIFSRHLRNSGGFAGTESGIHRPARTQRLNAACSVLLALCLAFTMVIAAPTSAYAVSASVYDVKPNPNGSQTVDEYFGIAGKVQPWLESHEHDDYYLGTEYDGWNSGELTESEIAHCRRPKGEVGSNDPGMNCTGFVTAVFMKLGADVPGKIPHTGIGSWCNTGNWLRLLEEQDVVGYEYDSVDALLKDGKAQKGDIILMLCTSSVWSAGVDKYGNYADWHIGFFWGDSPSDNKYWHSSHPVNGIDGGESLKYSNQISKIVPKAQSDKFFLLPVQHEGSIELTKTSNNPDMTASNGQYSLNGSCYTVYSDKALKKKVGTLKTNASGTATIDVAAGTYYIQETAAPHGYATDTAVYTVTVKASKTTKLAVKETPQSAQAGLLVAKHDADFGNRAQNSDTSGNVPQGGASLAGAEFTVKHFATDDASKGPLRTWVFATDEHGSLTLDAKHLVSGDALYTDSAGNPALPLGTYSIQETAAPAGYLLDDTVRTITVNAQGSTEHSPVYQTAAAPESVIRGGLSVQKLDAETDGNEPLGEATLEGAQFAVSNGNDNPVVVGGVTYQPGETILTLTTDSEGFAQTAEDALPYGRYLVAETVAPRGYLLQNDGFASEAFVGEQGKVSQVDEAAENQVKRGDIEFKKKDESSSTALAGIPFRITSETTGESHVIVTDENGYASTSSDQVPHSSQTNGNDGAAEPAWEIGVWFGVTESGVQAPVNDALGALPYDTYTIEELACEANADKSLVKQEHVVVHRDMRTVDLGTIDNLDLYMATQAQDASDGDQVVAADTEATIVDTVRYVGLQRGADYTLHAELMDASAGEPVLEAGEPVCADVQFAAKTPNDSVEVPITFDALALGQTGPLVVFETLLDAQGNVVTEHKDLEDKDQTVTVVKPEIGTTAADGSDGDKTVSASMSSTIVDTVAYKGLTPGKTYTVTGVLMDKGSGEPLLQDDQAITSSVEFTPEAAEGSVEVVFEFSSCNYTETSIVVFETLLRGDREVAVHADIEDEAQTVTVEKPSIRTTAVDGSDRDKAISAAKGQKIVDTVTYQGLVPGQEYRVSGTLVDVSTGEHVKVDGKELTSDAVFTPDKPSGSVDVTFVFDATSYGSSSIVVFETLYQKDVELAVHADLEDADQTVRVDQPDQPHKQEKGRGFSKTGSMLREYRWLAAALAGVTVAAASLGVWSIRRSRRGETS